MSTVELKLYNTKTRKVENFEPINEGEVGIYSCGPTVYHYAHIGNLRAYIFADVLRRTFTYAGYNVTHIINITDVGHLVSDGDDGQDKLEKGAAREGKDGGEGFIGQLGY
jgi:cysteinyl-tRNA synthetase